MKDEIMVANDTEDKKSLISSIQTDRRLLQDNIAMRVRYGWVLIGLIVGVITLISIPQENPIGFDRGLYSLSLIGYILSIVLILRALFTSHYGSSYKLFDTDLGLDEILSVEKSLHRRTLFKNQLSSLYCGESLFMTFTATMVLVIASPVNVLKDHDIVLIVVSMGCMFFAGSFLKKRMYRMYQIDRRSLPGIADSSMMGHVGHRISSGIRRILGKNGTYRKNYPAIEDELSELSYGRAILAFAFILEAMILTASYLTSPDSDFDYPLRILALLLFAAMAGFLSNQISLTATAMLHPSGHARRIASWNPLNLHALLFETLDLAIVVALILIPCVYGHEDGVALIAVSCEFIVLFVFEAAFRGDEDYIKATELERSGDGYHLQLKDGTAIVYTVASNRVEISVEPQPTEQESPDWMEASSEKERLMKKADAHRRKVCRLGLERILSDIESPDEIALYVPKAWVEHFKDYHRGRGYTDIDVRESAPVMHDSQPASGKPENT